MSQRRYESFAVVGAGKMGEILIRGLLGTKAVEPSQIVATARRESRTQWVAQELGVRIAESNARAVADADLVLLCVKPQMADGVLSELREVLREDQVLVSILASVTSGYMERRLDAKVPIVRAMPNTPSRISAGMTALCGGTHADEELVESVRTVFEPLGRTLVIDEKNMDAVTGLSASGPAFLYIVIEALAEGGVKVGLPRSQAIELAAQTCLGAARMVLETGQHPALLKDEVTTPAGCTIDGVLELEAGGLRVTLIKAIVEATRRAGELVEDG